MTAPEARHALPDTIWLYLSFCAWEREKRLTCGSGIMAHPFGSTTEIHWKEQSRLQWSWYDQSCSAVVIGPAQGSPCILALQRGELRCRPCTTSFQAQRIFQQDVQFHHLLL